MKTSFKEKTLITQGVTLTASTEKNTTLSKLWNGMIQKKIT